MTKNELAQAIDEAYQRYTEALEKLNVSKEELYQLWLTYQDLWIQACK